MGAAVGAALMGTRPIVELRFSDFALCAVDELVNQAAKARYMFGGQGRVPLVVREPIGMWRSSAAQHSQSLEGWYAHIPGLVVIAPSTPADNKGLLEGGDPLRRPGRLPGAQEPVGARRRGARRRHLVRDRQGAGGAGRQGPDDRVLVGGGARLPRRGGGAGQGPHRGRGDRPAQPVAVGQGGGAGERGEDRAGCWSRTRRCASAASAPRSRRRWPSARTGTLKGAVRRLGAPRAPIGYAPNLEDQVRVTPEQIAATARAMLRG